MFSQSEKQTVEYNKRENRLTSAKRELVVTTEDRAEGEASLEKSVKSKNY